MKPSEFDNHWTPEPYSGCWLWMNTRTRFGHGLAYHNGKQLLAHRFSWMIHKGPINTGVLVLHKCDTPGCVNPDHLFLGTYSDNTKDCISKGRFNSPQGEDHHRAKLSESQVREIRSSTEHDTVVAKRYGISRSHAYQIKKQRKWKHL